MEVLFLILFSTLIVYLWNKRKKDPEGYVDLQNKTAKVIENSVSYTNHNFNKIKKNIEKSSTLNYITNCTWVQKNLDSIDEILFTFQSNGVLLKTTNGIVENCKYELVVDNNSLVITNNGISELYDIINLKDDLIYLYKISTRENITLINKAKIKDFLKKQVEEENENKHRELKYYKYNKSHGFGFLASISIWQQNNPNKTVIDYVDDLSKKYNVDYIKWMSYNPNCNIYDYGEFIYDKFENKLQ